MPLKLPVELIYIVLHSVIWILEKKIKFSMIFYFTEMHLYINPKSHIQRKRIRTKDRKLNWLES